MTFRTTQEIRNAWDPPCDTSKFATFTHWTGVKITIDRRCIEAWQALDTVLVHHGYKPRAGVTGAYNCRAITGGTRPSLHSYGVAEDVNWDTNPYSTSQLITDMPRAMVDDIEAIRTRAGDIVFRWGGDWDGDDRPDDESYDAMHFEAQATPGELSVGIDWTTVAGHTPTPDPSREGDIDMATGILRCPELDNAQIFEFCDRVYRATKPSSINESKSTAPVIVVDKETWEDVTDDLKARGKLIGD